MSIQVKDSLALERLTTATRFACLRVIENSFFTSPQDFIREVQSRTGPSRRIGHSPIKLQVHVAWPAGAT